MLKGQTLRSEESVATLERCEKKKKKENPDLPTIPGANKSYYYYFFLPKVGWNHGTTIEHPLHPTLKLPLTL